MNAQLAVQPRFRELRQLGLRSCAQDEHLPSQRVGCELHIPDIILVFGFDGFTNSPTDFAFGTVSCSSSSCFPRLC